MIIEKRKGNRKMKTLVFDMDGTIANLYRVPNWLEMLWTLFCIYF